MQRVINWDSIKPVKGGEPMSKIPAGGYICKIVNVEDVADKQYLSVELDIAEGEFKNTYSDRYVKFGGNWGCRRICSYKEKALPMFKGFITAVEESNDRYQYDFDERTLKGKLVGVLFGEEEYIGNDGEIKTICKPQFFRSVSAIRAGDYEIPQLKKLSPADLERAGTKILQGSQQPHIGTDIPYPANDPFAASDDNIPF